ncbi:hypothetical protein BJY04DRAFT_204165 [Aspergillus karnatakaensis]|uniref:uncharacterized protein n=1 Tax=Aspergillus karnatakaensis TaxID=1810916 RepID=UPI003CCE4C5C
MRNRLAAQPRAGRSKVVLIPSTHYPPLSSPLSFFFLYLFFLFSSSISSFLHSLFRPLFCCVCALL